MIKTESDRIRVHYYKWGPKHDSWIALEEGRLTYAFVSVVIAAVYSRMLKLMFDVELFKVWLTNMLMI